MRKTIQFTGLLAVLLLSACGGQKHQSGIPTLTATAKATTPSGAATNTSNRPQLRLDTSKEEEQRLWTAYDDCLVAHGVKVNPVDQPGAVGDGPGFRLDQSGEPKEAYTACANKLPLQPPELDMDKNPNYAAQWNDNVKCLRAHGVMVHVTNPGEWTWDDDAVSIPANEQQIEHECLLEAFGGKTK